MIKFGSYIIILVSVFRSILRTWDFVPSFFVQEGTCTRVVVSDWCILVLLFCLLQPHLMVLNIL